MKEKMLHIIIYTFNTIFCVCNGFGQYIDKKQISKSADSSIVTIYVHDYDDKLIIGSGIFFDKSGLILSNAHVFRSWRSAEVYNQTFNQSFTIDRNCLKKDMENDVALFRIDTTNLKVINLGDSDSIAKGDDVFCIGSPGNLINTFTQGTIGGLPTFKAGTEGIPKKFIQFSAKIFEGSSGGALLDERGLLVGMTTGSIKNMETGFAIPINRIIQSINKLGNIQTCGQKIPAINPVIPTGPITRPDYTDQGFGQISFWTNCNSCSIDIYIDDEYIGKLEKYFVRVPTCGQTGTLLKNLYAGKHRIRAVDKRHNLQWNYEKQILKNECVLSQLSLQNQR